MTHEPETPLQAATDQALELFISQAEASGETIMRAAFFAVAESREAVTGGYGFDHEDEMFEFLLSYAQQLGKTLGIKVAVIDADQN